MISFVLHRRPPAAFPVKTIPRIARACSLLKKSLKTRSVEVGLSFISESEMRAMNHSYRKKNRPTDVLSFSSVEGKKIPGPQEKKTGDLGDIFICSTYASKEAKRRGIEAGEELVRLVVHGTLHLLGYDHADEVSERAMFSLQERIIERAMRI